MFKLIIFIIGISTSGAYGQGYTNYTTKNGLPSNHIYHAIQDSKGFMWFATNRGIAKFDGVEFKVFTTKDGLPNNDIWRLVADESGRVWWNTKSKYLGYIENDSVYKFMRTDKRTNTENFWRIDDNKIIYSQGLYIYYSLEKDSFRGQGDINYTKRIEKLEELAKKYMKKSSGLISSMYDFRSKESIIVVNDKIIFYDSSFNYVSKIQLNIFLPKKKSVNYSRMNGYLPNNSVLLSNSKGVIFVNSKEKRGVYYSTKNLVNKEHIEGVPLCIAIGKEIQVSIAGYLFILNQKFEIIKKYSFPNFPNNINSFKDKAGNIWLNNKNKGIILLPNTINFTTKFLDQKRIQKIGKFEGNIMVGEQKEGIHLFNPNLGTFSFQRDLRVENNIYQIKENKQLGIFYVVSSPSYIIYKDTISEKNKFKIKYIDSINSKRNIYKAGFKDIEFLNKHIYVLNSNSLRKDDSKTKKSINRILKRGLLTLSRYNGEIYAGGSDGLFLYESDSLIKVNGHGEILNASISYMGSDSNFLYIGTDGRGVYLYNRGKENYIRSTDGLIVQKIISKKNELWLATQNGVKVVSLNLDKLELSEITNSFYDSDGLLQNNTNDIFLEGSLLWIATDIGLSRINTANQIYKQKSSIIFDFKNDTVSYNYTRTGQVTATFHALNYTNQNYLRYQYRLLPSTQEWTEINTGSINFSGLSPNLYTLEVKTIDQHHNLSIGKQYIHILPAWWQTIWAKSGFIFLTLLSFFFLIKYIQIRIQKIELRKTKLAGLELQALRSQMNPHFVHNSLNSIKYYIQRNEAELSEEYLVKFSKLIRLFFDFSRRENVTLKEEILLLTLYLQIEQLRFEEKLSFQFDIDEKIDLEEVIIPSMLLQPLVENAVNHGIFHKKSKGKVYVVVTYIDSNQYQVVIEDDGVGINKAKSLYNPSSENYQSNSSEVIQDRLELLNKSEEWNISYVITDISEISNQQGTRISLLFIQNL